MPPLKVAPEIFKDIICKINVCVVLGSSVLAQPHNRNMEDEMIEVHPTWMDSFDGGQGSDTGATSSDTGGQGPAHHDASGQWMYCPGWDMGNPYIIGWFYVQGYWDWGVVLTWHVQRNMHTAPGSCSGYV